MALAVQDIFLFSDTIDGNIRLGARESITTAEVRSALNQSHASEFVDKMEEKENTVIGEPGTQLTMRTFHTGGVAGGDITQGLPRVEELFEARKPKKMATLSEIGGKVRFEDATKGSLLTALVHLLTSCLHNSIEVVDGSIDGSNITSLVSILQLLQCLLDAWLLVCWNLITVILQEVLGGEDHRVCLVHLVNLLALSLISSSVLLCLSLHAVDLVLTQAR